MWVTVFASQPSASIATETIQRTSRPSKDDTLVDPLQRSVVVVTGDLVVVLSDKLGPVLGNLAALNILEMTSRHRLA